MLWAKHCAECGGKNALVVPKWDNRWRHVCETCGATRYFNPVMVVGCLVEQHHAVVRHRLERLSEHVGAPPLVLAAVSPRPSRRARARRRR